MSALLRAITSNHNNDHCYMKIKLHENVCKNYDYCYIEMSEKGSILKTTMEKYLRKLNLLFILSLSLYLKK